MRKPRQSEENEMQLSRMQAAGCRSNGTVAAGHCALRNCLANFAMPISQGQYTVHLSHIKHQKLSEISHCEIRKPHCEFRKPLCQIRNPLPKFAISVGIAKFTLRNLQALSSSVINAEPPSIFGVLLFCPIT